MYLAWGEGGRRSGGGGFKKDPGMNLAGFFIDFDRIQVEALDVMKLNKAGVMVPEEAIWYDDGEIVNDEDFEGDWVEVEE